MACEMQQDLANREIAAVVWPTSEGKPDLVGSSITDGVYEVWSDEHSEAAFVPVAVVGDGEARWTDAAHDMPAGVLLVRRVEVAR